MFNNNFMRKRNGVQRAIAIIVLESIQISFFVAKWKIAETCNLEGETEKTHIEIAQNRGVADEWKQLSHSKVSHNLRAYCMSSGGKPTSDINQIPLRTTKIKRLSIWRFFHSPLINFTSSIAFKPLSRKIWFVFGLIIFACKIQSFLFHLTFCFVPVVGVCGPMRLWGYQFQTFLFSFGNRKRDLAVGEPTNNKSASLHPVPMQQHCLITYADWMESKTHEFQNLTTNWIRYHLKVNAKDRIVGEGESMEWQANWQKRHRQRRPS